VVVGVIAVLSKYLLNWQIVTIRFLSLPLHLHCRRSVSPTRAFFRLKSSSLMLSIMWVISRTTPIRKNKTQLLFKISYLEMRRNFSCKNLLKNLHFFTLFPFMHYFVLFTIRYMLNYFKRFTFFVLVFP